MQEGLFQMVSHNNSKNKRLALVVVLLALVLLRKFGPRLPRGAVGGGDTIAVMEINGVIDNSLPYLRELRSYLKDDSVKALIVRINSPGGAVAPSQEIYSELLHFRRTKKVVASLGTVAASGGYYIASAADRIVASPGTLTGSIGVIMQFMTYRDLMSKIGLNLETLKTGKFKDVGNAVRNMTSEEEQLMQGLLDDTYSQFFADVRTARNLDSTALAAVADGRVFTGRFAQQVGLVDLLGNFFVAVGEARRIAGLDEQARLVTKEKKRIDFPFSLLEGMLSVIGIDVRVPVGSTFKSPLRYQFIGG